MSKDNSWAFSLRNWETGGTTYQYGGETGLVEVGGKTSRFFFRIGLLYIQFFFLEKKIQAWDYRKEKCGTHQDRDDIPNHETRESNLGTKYFLKIRSLRMSTGLSDI